MSRDDRFAIALRRIPNILRHHTIATMRILEQKIADAGPFNQRVDPHLLTAARNELAAQGAVLEVRRARVPYYHLAGTPADRVSARLDELSALHDRTVARHLTVRLGQTLEIAVFRALTRGYPYHFFGGFSDLDLHDDSSPYSKEEPPVLVSGRASPGPVDFLVSHPQAALGAIEAKNVREWVYPDSPQVRDLIHKAVSLDAVPILVARRISYATFSVLNPTGFLVHQVFNQLYPEADRELASLASQKDLLGYHDIRVGNEPDARLSKFIATDLPSLLPQARKSFDEYKDLLAAYGDGSMDYPEFAGRSRRRLRGEVEDGPAEWFQ